MSTFATFDSVFALKHNSNEFFLTCYFFLPPGNKRSMLHPQTLQWHILYTVAVPASKLCSKMVTIKAEIFTKFSTHFLVTMSHFCL